MRFATKQIHAGVEPDPTTGAIPTTFVQDRYLAILTPIYQSTTFVQESVVSRKRLFVLALGKPDGASARQEARRARRRGSLR